MSRFFINILFISLFWSVSGQSKIDSLQNKSKSLPFKISKVRFGFDMGKYIWAKNKSSTSIDFAIDANFYKEYFLMLNWGKETHLTDNNLLNYTTDGQYFKIGVGYNLYHNWLDMNNDIIVGLQYAQANFDYVLNSYRINQPGALFPPELNVVNTSFNNNQAHWLELGMHLQAETFQHLFLGYSIVVKYLLTTTPPQGFDLAYIPGFNEKNAYSNFGFGMQYFISYQFKF